MPRDKSENHEKIIAAAYEEFMKYGFADASMRRIASACGMSASGLYKHFAGKEEMFAALVEPAYKGLVEAYNSAASEEIDAVDESLRDDLWNNSDEIVWIMEYIYDNLKAFKLLVCRSQGTRLENYVHELAILEEQNTRQYMEKLKSIGAEINLITEKEMHILVTSSINAIFMAVEHDLTREEAMAYARRLNIFFEAGWETLFRRKDA